MKEFKIGSVFAILAVALTIIAIPATVMAAINSINTTKIVSFHYTANMEQTKYTDPFNLGAPDGTTGSASTKFTWTSAKHSLQTGYYTEVSLQKNTILGLYGNVVNPTKLENFTTSTTAYVNYKGVPYDVKLRFKLYNYAVESIGDVVMTATY